VIRLPQHDAVLVALLLATNPDQLKGVSLHGLPGPGRDAWIALYQTLRGSDAPLLKVPVNVTDDRLLGGLDIALTLASGRPEFAQGLVESADGGTLLIGMAERMHPGAASIVADVLERCSLRIERDGQTRDAASSFAVIALDEGIEEDERLPGALSERLAFRIEVDSIREDDLSDTSLSASTVAAARDRLRDVMLPEAMLQQLSSAAIAFGVHSLRAEWFMIEAARTAAAICGRKTISDDDAAMAARLVLPHRATRMPAEQQNSEPPPEQPEEPDESEESPAQQPELKTIPDDVLVDAVAAALPPDLLDSLKDGLRSSQATSGGRAGPVTKSRLRGRPVGVLPARTLRGHRLNILATLKAAAPWQTLRRRKGQALSLRPQDLQVTKFEDRVETVTLFVVDASGSQAARRLAEVKGAIELLLNECYVRRDHVALIAFRKDSAEVLLEPTRALAKVKRSLSSLPGGGGTPLACGIDAARELARAVRRQGRRPAVVFLTDGRANIGRDGTPGVAGAESDMQQSAAAYRSEDIDTVVVDTSFRPKPRSRLLADAMGARYVALPNGDAERISASVQRNLAA